MAGSGYTVATARVKKTSRKEKVKVQDTCKIGTEIKNMHEKLVEVDQVMGSSLTPNNKGVHDDRLCKKNLKEYIIILYANVDGLSNKKN